MRETFSNNTSNKYREKKIIPEFYESVKYLYHYPIFLNYLKFSNFSKVYISYLHQLMLQRLETIFLRLAKHPTSYFPLIDLVYWFRYAILQNHRKNLINYLPWWSMGLVSRFLIFFLIPKTYAEKIHYVCIVLCVVETQRSVCSSKNC